MHNIKLTPLCDTMQFLDISDEEYFSPKYADYISNSKLSLVNPEQGGSPRQFIEGFSGNKYSDSFLFGSAVHGLLLQPESFTLVETVDRPTAKLGYMADELYPRFLKDWDNADFSEITEDIVQASKKIDYYQKSIDTKIESIIEKCTPYWESRRAYEHMRIGNKTPIYLDAKSRERLKECLLSVERNRNIQNLLNPSYIVEKPLSVNEGTLVMDVKAFIPAGLFGCETDEEYILKLKAKLDNFTVNKETKTLTLNDLKTTGHWLSKFNESFNTYHYYRQMAMYMWMLAIYCKEYHGFRPEHFYANMLVVSTVPDFRSGVYQVTARQQKQGMEEFSKLLRMALLTLYKRYDFDDGIEL